jgi:hydrogenase maturation protease
VLPEGVTVRDFGIRGYDLAFALTEDYERVILVDAARRGGKPGTLYLIEPDLEQLSRLDRQGLTEGAHDISVGSALRLCRFLGAEPRRICLVGCEPETLEPLGDAQFVLSEPVQRAAEAAVERIEAMLRENSAAKGDQA